MPTIDTNYTPRAEYKIEVRNDTPLTHDEVNARILEVQDENLKAIEDGLNQNSTGWGDKVKIKVPADANGNPLYNPSAQDWENAAKNSKWAVAEETPASLAERYFNVSLVDFGNAANNRTANSTLLKELREALGKGISFPTTETLPRSEVGDVVRALQARQRALRDLERSMGNPNAGTMDPPRQQVDIKVPADAKGNPIKNPTTRDWVDAQKNNRWATVSGSPEKLAADHFGLKIDMQNWRASYSANKAAFKQTSDEGSSKFEENMRIANGEFLASALLDIPNAGQIIQEVFKVLGPAYNSELSKANDLREQMDSLRKKNDALQKLENSISSNDTSGRNFVDFDVPTRRYVYDSEGNKVLDSNGKPKTESITQPATEQDWARAAEWKSIKELEGKEINGRDAANKYLGIQLSHIDGDNAHNTNLSNNIQKIGNARTAVQSEMSKLSGQFDFRMGNSQTNLQNANKIIGNINEIMLGIARAI
jgi:hypothetical protein